MSFTLPTITFNYHDFEPYFDAQTMEIHYTKHHQAYVDNLNKAIANTDNEHKTIEELLAKISTLSAVVKNNAGGHWNHTFFWTLLAKHNTPTEPSSIIKKAIENSFGSFDTFKEQFAAAALTRFGSGWAWLIVDDHQNLKITSTPNQDNPLMDVAEVKGKPVLGIDVWEHAYYLKYQNKRADYINAFWNIINWAQVEKYFQQ